MPSPSKGRHQHRQRHLRLRAPDHSPRPPARGRVFAFYDVTWQTGRLASIGIGGVLAATFAVHWAGGLLLLAAGTLGLTAGRTIRHELGL